MSEIAEIADTLERTAKAMDALDPADPEHVRTRLKDFSTVLISLRERVLALEPQPLTENKTDEN